MNEQCKNHDEYVKDTRIACKYGAKCYQKNKVHHEKYKHPPKRTTSEDDTQGPSKKRKITLPSKKYKPPTKAHPNSDDDSKGGGEESGSENSKDNYHISDSESDDEKEQEKKIGDNKKNESPKDKKQTISNNISDSEEDASSEERTEDYLDRIQGDLEGENGDCSKTIGDSPKKTEGSPKKTDVSPKKTEVSLKKTEVNPKKIEVSPKKTEEGLKKTQGSPKTPKDVLKKTEDSPQKVKGSTNKPKDIPKKTEDNSKTPKHTPKTAQDPTYSSEKDFIKFKFLVDMPEDFYLFWDLCKVLNPKNPSEAFGPVGLSLVGPFDVLAGKFSKGSNESSTTSTTGTSDPKIKSDEDYLLHWRYYYDPPEFQTVIKGDATTGFHIGYFRDSPKEPPVFTAGNHAKKDGIIKEMGENIYAAVNIHLEQLKKSGDPFKKMHVSRLQSPLKKDADKNKLSLEHKTEKMRMRVKRVVAKTFNTAGLVVPYDKKSQVGYRELTLKDADLKKILGKLKAADEEQKPKILSELQPCMTFASIATDECDFGTGLELGLDILSYGIEGMNLTVERFLVNSYRLIDREEFARIAEVHMKNRKKGCTLSIL